MTSMVCWASHGSWVSKVNAHTSWVPLSSLQVSSSTDERFASIDKLLTIDEEIQREGEREMEKAIRLRHRMVTVRNTEAAKTARSWASIRHPANLIWCSVKRIRWRNVGPWCYRKHRKTSRRRESEKKKKKERERACMYSAQKVMFSTKEQRLNEDSVILREQDNRCVILEGEASIRHLHNGNNKRKEPHKLNTGACDVHQWALQLVA